MHLKSEMHQCTIIMEKHIIRQVYYSLAHLLQIYKYKPGYPIMD